jgi:molybdate transport system regulatory protein
MQISARNALRGRVTTVTRGAVNAEVTIALDGGPEVVSIITLACCDRLGLAPGKAATAIIKASDVLVATE